MSDEIKTVEAEVENNGVKSEVPVIVRQTSVAEIAERDPKRALEIITARMDGLDAIRKRAFQSTNPNDWTLNKDKEGNVIGTLRSSGSLRVMQAYGISVYNLRPSEPSIQEDGDGKTYAMITGDAYCALTNSRVENLVGIRYKDEHFTGRGYEGDLKSSARTSLHTKAAQILAGMKSVPEDELKEFGIDTSKCIKGSGFGTSAERQADKTVDADTKTLRDELSDKLTKYAAGDLETAAKVLKEITANPPKFDGFDSLKKMTQKWQVKQALEKLEILMSEGGAE